MPFGIDKGLTLNGMLKAPLAADQALTFGTFIKRSPTVRDHREIDDDGIPSIGKYSRRGLS
jgi:hypothetical protein